MKNHTCEAALITCEDFRLHQRKDGRNYIAEFIKDLDVSCDLITRAGGTQDIVRPKEEAYCECALRDLEVSIKLHYAKTIYLVNHADCGAYRGMKFTSDNDEFDLHKQDLILAKERIQKEHPELKVKLYLAKLKEGTEDEFTINKIS